MKKRIAINGFGRIGRSCLKVLLQHQNIELVAVNDLMNIENAAYLLKYDTIYGKYEKSVSIVQGKLSIGSQAVTYLSQSNPQLLPWKDLMIDIVIEATGVFTNQFDAQMHIDAGAKCVVISGPTNDTPTIVYGVNTKEGRHAIFSCGSCTTNNITPLMEILGRRIGIKKAILNTTHAYTASQSLVDAPNKIGSRMGRTAGQNIAPASTGAAIATTKVLPQYTKKFDGVAVRVPVAVGSISDLTFIAARPTTVKEINEILIDEAHSIRYYDVIAITDEPLVSTDIIKCDYAAIIDLDMTRVVDGDLVKIMSWYDNEWGFTNQMIKQILSIPDYS